jgi:hypothetical protein
MSAAVLAAGLALVAAARPAHAVNVALEWTAPGDDSTFGTAVEYDLRYSFKPYFPNRFNDAPRWMATPQPGPAGTVQRCIITDLDEETVWYFAIKARDERGNSSTISNIIAITPSVDATGGEHWKLAFSEAVPSPARTATRFAFSLPRKGRVLAEAVDVSGRRVRRLLDAEMAAGPHDLDWNLRDDEGRTVSPGIYFVRAEAGGQTFRRRVVVMR